jgi:hypothetical protein
MQAVEQEFATPGDALAHFGIKGMRWGHHTVESVTTTTTTMTRRGEVKTRSMLKSAKPYRSAVVQAAGAAYLRKQGYIGASALLGVSAGVSATRAYNRRPVQ